MREQNNLRPSASHNDELYYKLNLLNFDVNDLFYLWKINHLGNSQKEGDVNTQELKSQQDKISSLIVAIKNRVQNIKNSLKNENICLKPCLEEIVKQLGNIAKDASKKTNEVELYFQELGKQLRNMINSLPKTEKTIFEMVCVIVASERPIVELECENFVKLRFEILGRINNGFGQKSRVYLGFFPKAINGILYAYMHFLQDKLKIVKSPDEIKKIREEINLTNASLKFFEDYSSQFEAKHDRLSNQDLSDLQKLWEQKVKEYKNMYQIEYKNSPMELYIEILSKFMPIKDFVNYDSIEKIAIPNNSKSQNNKKEFLKIIQDLVKHYPIMKGQIELGQSIFNNNEEIINTRSLKRALFFAAKVLLESVKIEEFFDGYFEAFDQNFKEKTIENCSIIVSRTVALQEACMYMDSSDERGKEKENEKTKKFFKYIQEKIDQIAELTKLTELAQLTEPQDFNKIRKPIETTKLEKLLVELDGPGQQDESTKSEKSEDSKQETVLLSAEQCVEKFFEGMKKIIKKVRIDFVENRYVKLPASKTTLPVVENNACDKNSVQADANATPVVAPIAEKIAEKSFLRKVVDSIRTLLSSIAERLGNFLEKIFGKSLRKLPAEPGKPQEKATGPDQTKPASKISEEFRSPR